MGALGQRLGQGQAREAGTESSGLSGISLSRAASSYSLCLGSDQRPGRFAPKEDKTRASKRPSAGSEVSGSGGVGPQLPTSTRTEATNRSAKRAIAPPAEPPSRAGFFLRLPLRSATSAASRSGGIRHNYLFPYGTIISWRHSEITTAHNF
jgi:hypothetical protein